MTNKAPKKSTKNERKKPATAKKPIAKKENPNARNKSKKSAFELAPDKYKVVSRQVFNFLIELTMESIDSKDPIETMIVMGVTKKGGAFMQHFGVMQSEKKEAKKKK